MFPCCVLQPFSGSQPQPSLSQSPDSGAFVQSRASWARGARRVLQGVALQQHQESVGGWPWDLLG